MSSNQSTNSIVLSDWYILNFVIAVLQAQQIADRSSYYSYCLLLIDSSNKTSKDGRISTSSIQSARINFSLRTAHFKCVRSTFIATRLYLKTMLLSPKPHASHFAHRSKIPKSKEIYDTTYYSYVPHLQDIYSAPA